MEIDPGGTASNADVRVVAAEYARLPAAIDRDMTATRLRVTACRGSVVDFASDLRGVHPDGWPQGATWDIVPGAFLPDRRIVVIATISDADGGRRVPRRGEGHGSFSLAVHEALHGFDAAERTVSATTGFRQAWSSDAEVIAAEGGSDYFLNTSWGPRESFAESGARTFGIDASAAPVWPRLRSYWEGLVDAGLQPAGAPPPSPDREAETEGNQFIGTAMTDGQDVLLDLIARDPGGAEGHAQLRIAGTDHRRSNILRNIVTPQSDWSWRPDLHNRLVGLVRRFD